MRLSTTPKFVWVAVIAMLAGGGTLLAGYRDEFKLTASDAAASDWFGTSVAVSGNTALVGARHDDHAGGTDAGSAYIFVRSGTEWVEQAKLTASDAEGHAWFGDQVALEGDTAVVGALIADSPGINDAGLVYVFERDGENWSEQAILSASDAAVGDNFGSSVALSGDTLVVGAKDGNAGAGAAYVFVRDGGGWSEQARLVADDGVFGDLFGLAVAVAGHTAVVGARLHDHAAGLNAGAAYVYFRNGAAWSQQEKLVASDAETGDYFGNSVAAAGDTVLVGARFHDDAAGAAYVFVRDGAGWVEQVKLTASDATFSDQFGMSVALSGDSALVGAWTADVEGDSDAGSAYVFVRNGASWSEQIKLTASDGEGLDHLGFSVALDGVTAVAGAYGNEHSGAPSAGAAYVYLSLGGGDDVPAVGGPGGVLLLLAMVGASSYWLRRRHGILPVTPEREQQQASDAGTDMPPA